ncbi:MAG TPA: hypothetical protein VFT22_07490 [Kofleriaceae bacterium]|nr:hypothetical protein [Kofleriaceae bacterium]
MGTELTDAMLDDLKRDFCVETGPLAWVFAACCDASQPGVSLQAGRERTAARARLTEWLSSDDGLSTARSIGFVCVATLEERVRELEAELSDLKTCDTCEEPATRHVCRHHCHC